MHPHILFPNNQYSVYIDGNIGLRGNHLFKRVQELITNQALLSVAKHPIRDCVYDEAEECLRLNKSDTIQILNQVIFLKNKAYPRSNGLIESGIIFRKHHNPELIDLMNSWWSLFSKFQTRDQLSFNYILWEKEFSDLEYFFDRDVNQLRNSSDYIFELHNYEKVEQDINEKVDRSIIHRVFIRFKRYSRDFIVFINRFAKNPLYQFIIKQILRIKF